MPSQFFSFGPPDIFKTQADTYQNSFGNPINSANLNPGWRIDPSLLTPGYQAPYRPQYSGTQPYNMYGRVGFFGGINRLYNPFIREPAWGNPVDTMQPSVEGISGRPFDAAMWAGQRIAAPALAFGASYRLLGPQTFIGYLTGKGVAGGLGRAVGSGFGRGLATSIGLGATRVGLTAAAFGTVGSIAGAVVVPALIAQAALWGAEKTIFNPYINTRREAMDLRRNFSGQSFADAEGNVVSGGGLSYSESSRMAGEITRAGIQDMTFSAQQMVGIADMSARAGLMDNVKAKQITQRVKDVAEQIKLIMAISKDPDIKNAIEELSKLNIAGADVTGGRFSVAAGAYRNLGQYASMAGVSVQRLMNTVGAQGQYLFQSNGMTPYLGQLAAGNVYAGFSAAQRVGLMSPAQLARMGGIEGATQSSLTGMMAVAQTPYNQMALYNQFALGARGSSTPGQGQNVTDVVRQFGAAAARNPLGALGGMMLYGRQLAGKQISEQGAVAIENQIVSLMDASGIQRGRNGKFSAEQMVPFLMNAGMSMDQITAFISQRASETNPGVVKQQLRGVDRFAAEQMRQVISQNTDYGGWIGSSVRGLKHFGRDITEGVFDYIGSPLHDASGAIADWITGGTDSLQFGSTIGKGTRVSDVNTLFQKNAPKGTPVKLIDTGMLTIGRSQRVLRTINDMAKEGDTAAISFINIKNDPAARRKALGQLIRNNKDRFGDDGVSVLDNNNPSNFQDVLDTMDKDGRYDSVLGQSVDVSDKVTSDFQKTTGSKDFNNLENMQAIGAAFDLAEKLAPGGTLSSDNIDDALNSKDPRYDSLRKLLKGKTGSHAVAAINDIFKRSVEYGTYTLGRATFAFGIKNNINSIVDPKLRAQYNRATSDIERANIVARSVVKDRTGGVVEGDRLKGAEKFDPSDVMRDIQPQTTADDQRMRLLENLKSHGVDFATTIRTLNTFDQKKITDKFSSAVDKFDVAVGKIAPKDNASPSSTPSVISWASSLVSSTSDTVKKVMDPKR